MENNIIDIPSTYLKFFVKNYEERYQILMGGRRSGKTFSTLLWLYFLCSGQERLNVQIAAPSYSLLQATMQDARDCLGITTNGSKVYGDHTILPNGSLWQFISYDCMEKTVGRKADILFLNEAILLPEQAFGTLMQGIRKFAILNFNPTKNTWIQKYIKEDNSNLLITTFKDNPYLTEYQIEEFENIKKRALSPTATIFDKYAYEVFYKGVFTNMSGKVFRQVYSCTTEEFNRIPVESASGMDFGIVDSGDFTTLVQVKIYQNCLYCNELLYSNHLANDKDLAWELHRLGYDNTTTIVCDPGGLGAQRADNIRNGGSYTWEEPEIADGVNCIHAKKPKVLESIQEILQYDKIILTDTSINLRREMDNYELTSEGKPKGVDHAIDAMRYAHEYYKYIDF